MRNSTGKISGNRTKISLHSQCRNSASDIFRRFFTEKDEEPKPWYCYIVRCSDDTLYTGISTDPERRIAMHNKGKGASYTASRRPVIMVYCETVGTKGDALRRELQIKALTRKQKMELIKSNEQQLTRNQTNGN